MSRPSMELQPWTPEAPTGLWQVTCEGHPEGDPDTGALVFAYQAETREVSDPSGRLTEAQERAAKALADAGWVAAGIGDLYHDHPSHAEDCETYQDHHRGRRCPCDSWSGAES